MRKVFHGVSLVTLSFIMLVSVTTLADIVAEMRKPHDEICEKCHEEPNESCPYCGDPNGCNSPDHGRWPGVMTEFADRIEAAAKREAATAEKSSVVGKRLDISESAKKKGGATMSGEICGDKRFEIIDAAKKKLIETTNIETSADEMAVLDSILFRMWQMKWLPGCAKIDKNGNRSKMREALEKIRNQAYLNPDDMDAQRLVTELGDIAADALTAQPRNCDKYKSLKEACSAWRESAPVDKDNVITMSFDEWLFATAKEEPEKATEEVNKAEVAEPETPPPLAPCPKCGKTNVHLIHPALDGGAYVCCWNCHYSSQAKTWAPTDVKAAIKWNNLERGGNGGK